jgi:hypothetical protein
MAVAENQEITMQARTIRALVRTVSCLNTIQRGVPDLNAGEKCYTCEPLACTTELVRLVRSWPTN